MKRINLLGSAMMVIGSLLAVTAAQAATIAHWDFNATNAVDGAFMPGNGDRQDLDGDGAMDTDDFRISAIDLSGNGNHLTAWTSAWMKWSSDSAQGDFSMSQNNAWPAAGTDSDYNPFISGTDAEAITPAQWTIEALFKSENLGGNHTIVGRDGRYVGGNNSSAAALYLSTRGNDLAIEYTDVNGGQHNLQVAANLQADAWYCTVAVSDGATLTLFLNGEAIGTLDLTTTGTNTALAKGYGTWSVARGMWAGGHVDRFYGVIDEVAISDEALVPASFVIPLPPECIDTDHDGMIDLYENFFSLNPTNSADAQANYDNDTLINLMEALLQTDPYASDTDTDGLNDGEDDNPLSRAVMMWGHPGFTSGDTYNYTGPDWWLGSGKIGGVWTNGPCWVVPAYEEGKLYIDIDRELINKNLMLNLMHQNVGECAVYLDLGGTNGTYVATDLYGDLANGDGSQELGRYVIPLESYPGALRIIIDATAGSEPYTVWIATLYEDIDADGLDAEQEIQFGTLDTNPDTDTDNLTDYIEAIVEHTNPLDPDTDHDGFTDGQELYDLGTSPTVPMWLEGGMPGFLQVERWNSLGGELVSDLANAPRFGSDPNQVSAVTSSEYADPATLHLGDYYGIRMRGTITAPVAGEYTFHLTGDNTARFWLSDTESPFDRKLLLDLRDWTAYRDIGDADAPSATVELASNQVCYVEILFKEAAYADHVSLLWTLPGQSTPEVIGPQYLRSYVQPEDDADMDGMSDEFEILNGLDSLDGTGGGYKDVDGDGYGELLEARQGTDPNTVDEDSDGLPGGDEVSITWTDPYSADTDADGTNDLTLLQHVDGSDIVAENASHNSSTWTVMSNTVVLAGLNSYYSINTYVSYGIDNPVAGMHHVAVQAEWDGGLPPVGARPRMAFFVDGYRIAITELVPNDDGTGTWSCFTPWLSTGSHVIRCQAVALEYDTPGFAILGLELGAIDGLDADGNGVQDWMEEILAKGLDTDGDGIADVDEINVHGTGVTDADSDDDGLSDGEELAAGTDPLNADSDGDGVLDGVEVKEVLTNPLEAEFDGTSATVLTVSGIQTNGAAGEWEAEGSEIVSTGRRGYVEYVLDYPEQDLYRLRINASHVWEKTTCSPVEPVYTSAFLIYVDGIFIGEYPFVCADGAYEDVLAFLPVLPAGSHTVRVFWENVHTRLGVKINELQLQSLGGPDFNGNGVKDWVEAAIAAMAGVDTTESFISPACVEGDARYPELASLAVQSTNGNQQSAITRGAGPRWYASLPLDTNNITLASASFQNGALQVPVSVEWVPYNLMEHVEQTLYIRKGDSVKFTMLPESAHGGQFEIDAGAGAVRSPNTRPLVFGFPETGSFTVSGTYTHGNSEVSATVNVVVIDGAFPNDRPACLVGKEREWTFTGMPSNVVYETDSSVDMAVKSTSLTTNNQQSTTVSLEARDANGTHMMVARTSPGGPILGAVKLSSCWIQNAADGYFWTVDRFEDSELWEVESIQRNLPDSVDIRIKVFVAGVTLDDYTLERWITNGDYDETGIYRFRLSHPNNAAASVCHTFMVYQDGEFLGEILGGEQGQ